MEPIRQYILSVICMAILCGLVQNMFSGNHQGGIVKIVTGLMLTITVMGPLMDIDFLSVENYFDTLLSDSQWAVEAGELAAEKETTEIIKDQSSAYICDKANALGAELTVDVEVKGCMPPIPHRVTIMGSASPYVKKQLAVYMENELGILEENQLWIS